MFLHLGADTVIPIRDVISITYIKKSKSNINKEFLSNAYKNKKVIDISENNPKSFIVTNSGVYLSAISSLTLKKRAFYTGV